MGRAAACAALFGAAVALTSGVAASPRAAAPVIGVATERSPNPAAALPATGVPAAARGTLLRTRDLADSLVAQPGGRFAALVFHDDAHDDHVGVVYRGLMRGTRDGAWSLDDRFWQDPAWSGDANALVWAPGADVLFVSTGDHGTGAVFRLDLPARKAQRVWPNDATSPADQGAGRSCEIMNVDPVKRLLHVRYLAAAGRTPVAVEVWMK